jgi:hypothetical protein
VIIQSVTAAKLRREISPRRAGGAAMNVVRSEQLQASWEATTRIGILSLRTGNGQPPAKTNPSHRPQSRLADSRPDLECTH